MAHWPLTEPILNALLGYLRVFDDLPQAVAAAEPYSAGGHLCSLIGTLHFVALGIPAAQRLCGSLSYARSNRWLVQDFRSWWKCGQSVLLLQAVLNLTPQLVWQVYDLPMWTEEGRRLAAERGEKQLQFTRNWEDASGVDLLLVSGSLHFFDPPVYHMVAELPEKPAHILINRSPLIDGPTKATVQDGNNHRTARILYNRGN